MKLLSMTDANGILLTNHYLGPSRRGFAIGDERGVMVFANPSSRMLPHDSWLELVRWCILGGANAGSQMFRDAKPLLRQLRPDVTTLVSYSDPSVGHTGALYRACNWLWAPTWHRLRTPPSGNGDWGSGRQGVKDRWVFPLRRDPSRAELLRIRDVAIVRSMPWAEYREGAGGDYKRWAIDRDNPRVEVTVTGV